MPIFTAKLYEEGITIILLLRKLQLKENLGKLPRSMFSIVSSVLKPKLHCFKTHAEYSLKNKVSACVVS